jgi:hypothetical protein
MKTLLACASLLVSITSAHAQQASDAYFLSDPSRDLTRLNYYPHSGKFYVEPDAQYTATDLNIPATPGTPKNPSSAHSWQLDLDLIYGLPVDGLRFYLSESYLAHRWTDTTSVKTGFVTQSDSSGFSDPTFELQYRYFETEPLGFSGDVSLSFSPSWVTDDIASSLSSGSDGKGYGTLALTATEYKLFPVADFGLGETLSHQFSGNAVNAIEPTDSYSRDSVFVFTVTATARLHINEDFYVQGAAGVEFPYSVNQTTAAAVATTTQTPFHINPELLAGYRVLANFCVDVLYTYQNYTRTTVPSAPPNTTTFVLENTAELRARIEI